MPHSLAKRMTLIILHVSVCSVGLARSEEPSTAFRVRSDFAARLNANQGWAGQQNEDVTVLADRPFRIRFEAELSHTPESFRLQYRRNRADWKFVEAYDFPNPAADVVFDFSSFAAGSTPSTWTIASGDKANLVVKDTGVDKILRADAGDTSLIGLCPWPTDLPEFELTAEFRLPKSNLSGIGLVFGFMSPENYCSVILDASQGAALVTRRFDGRETTLHKEKANIVSEQWTDLSVEFEDSALTVVLDDGQEFNVEVGDTDTMSAVGFLVPAQGSADFKRFRMQGAPRTPRISIVSCPTLSSDEASTNLLTGSTKRFCHGQGISFAKRTKTWSGTDGHAEFEWPLVIRYFADGPVINEAGDTFEIRMVTSEGQPTSKLHPRLELAIPPGHLGGTFVETPGRIGPWRTDNGDLYFIMEPTETDNVFMMMKSNDGGLTWLEVDAVNRPRTADLEAVDARRVGPTIHIVHQVTEATYYHAFHTSDHSLQPDSWAIRDQTIARIPAHSQAAGLVHRSDKSMVAFFVGEKSLHYSIRSTTGDWTSPLSIHPKRATYLAGPQAVLGDNDIVHLAYYANDGSIWYRSLQPSGQLTPPQLISSGAGNSRADYGVVLPLLYIPKTQSMVAIYRLASGELWERRVESDGTLTEPVRITDQKVVQNAVDSQQPGADAVLDGTTVHVLFIEEQSRAIFRTNDKSGWRPAKLVVDNILGSWVRGNTYARDDGTRVYGFVYDAGSYGGTGLNRFLEVPFRAHTE